MNFLSFRNIPMFLYNTISLENMNRRANCVVKYKPSLLENIHMYGCVLFYIEESSLKEFFYELWAKNLFEVYRIVVIIKTQKCLESLLKDTFTVIETAGGIVRKEDRILLELKYKVWDLPKGHVEKNEDPTETAKREIFEECGVECSIIHPYLSTCYTFLVEKEICIKHVNWFLMNCIDDSKMKPQEDEGIKEVSWIQINDLQKKRMYTDRIYLLNTYLNILPLNPAEICKDIL